MPSKPAKAAPEAEQRAGSKREPSAPKRPADAAEEAATKPKRIKEDSTEPSGTTPPPATVPRAAAGPPLPAAELRELVVQLTRAMEAAPPDEEAIGAVLAKLEGAGMTLDLLRETGVGKTVNALKKLTVAPALAGRARALVDQWKTLQNKKE